MKIGQGPWIEAGDRLKNDACKVFKSYAVGVSKVLGAFALDKQSGSGVSTWIQGGFKEIGMLASSISIDQEDSNPVGDIQHTACLVIRSDRVGWQFSLDNVRPALGKDDLDVPRCGLTWFDPFEKQRWQFGDESRESIRSLGLTD